MERLTPVELTADLFSSLDGFAAGENTEAFYGYSGPDLDRWVRETQDQPQLIVMGRVTYQALAGISPAATDPVSSRLNELDKVVFSSTLEEPLAWANTRLIRGGLAEGIQALKEQSAVPLRTIGSLSLVRSLMRLGLVDVFRVTVFPLVLGPDGREPIYAGYPRGSLELTGTRILDGRIVMLDYRPARG
ncbi:MAG TPA: dihydrofolate reductase family protein [Streptosporangiaceae bacterium]